MAANLLPADADPSQVFVAVTNYEGGKDNERFVVPLNGLVAAGSGGGNAGNATLVGGTIAVANTGITADSIIIIGRKTIGGSAGNLSYTLNAGVGFTINSSSGTDTSTVSYLIV